MTKGWNRGKKMEMAEKAVKTVAGVSVGAGKGLTVGAGATGMAGVGVPMSRPMLPARI